MSREMAFDALSRNEQYASLCFIKFQFMDETITLHLKSNISVLRICLKNFSDIISTTKYEQYVNF